MAELHVPLWIAQRLWIGAASSSRPGAGDALPLRGRSACPVPDGTSPSFAFMFTPYVLQYTGRISVILMPWAGLPWMIAFVILALRRGGWRYPALFALVVALVSGINASSILYVGIAPVLWLPYAVLVLGEGDLAEGLGRWRGGSALLTALVSLWWVVGLQVEAAYGVNILKYTETVPATSSSSLAFRDHCVGSGYWYFYGASDQIGTWTQAAVAYTQNLWLIAASFLVPVLGLPGRGLRPLATTARTSSSWSSSAWCWPSVPIPTTDPSACRLGLQGVHGATPPPDWPCARPTGPRRSSSSAWPCSSVRA